MTALLERPASHIWTPERARTKRKVTQNRRFRRCDCCGTSSSSSLSLSSSSTPPLSSSPDSFSDDLTSFSAQQCGCCAAGFAPAAFDVTADITCSGGGNVAACCSALSGVSFTVAFFGLSSGGGCFYRYEETVTGACPADEFGGPYDMEIVVSATFGGPPGGSCNVSVNMSARCWGPFALSTGIGAAAAGTSFGCGQTPTMNNGFAQVLPSGFPYDNTVAFSVIPS